MRHFFVSKLSPKLSSNISDPAHGVRPFDSHTIVSDLAQFSFAKVALVVLAVGGSGRLVAATIGGLVDAIAPMPLT